MLTRLQSPHGRRIDLIRALLTFYRFDSPYERALHHNDFAHFPYEATPLVWLRHDLSHLGVMPENIPVGSGARGFEGIASLEGYLSYLYLKQGSSLGGQVMAKRLEQNGVLSSNNTCEFFYRLWRRNLDLLAKILGYLQRFDDQLDRELLAQQAVYQFELQERYFKIEAERREPAHA